MYFTRLKIFLLIAIVLVTRCSAKSRYCVNSFCNKISEENNEEEEEEEEEETESEEDEDENEESDEDETDEDEETRQSIASKYRGGRLEASQYEDFYDVELSDDLTSSEFNDGQGGTGVLDESKRWTKRGTKVIVPYTIEISSLLNTQKSKISAAIHEIESKTCVKFVNRNFEENYITFRSSSGKRCSSVVGMHGGQQFINLEKDLECGNVKGTIMHEILHALGFHHMHTHSQRDKYIKFYEKNIDNFLNNRNYFLNDAKKVSSFNTKYDFFSIMHYPPYNREGKRIIKPKEDYMFYDKYMGQRKVLSDGDITRVNNMYSCSEIGNSKKIQNSDIRQKPIERTKNVEQNNGKGIYFEKKEHTIFHQYTRQNNGPLRPFPFNDDENDDDEEEEEEEESEEKKSDDEEEDEDDESDEE